MWKKVIAPTVIVVLCWCLSSIATTWYIHWLELSQSKMITEDLTTLRAAEDLRFDIRRMERTLTAASTVGTGKTLAGLDDAEKEFRAHLRDAVATSFTQEELDLDALILKRFESYRTLIRSQAAEIPADLARSIEETQERQQLRDGLSDAARQLGDVNERLMRERTTRQSRFNSSIAALRYGLIVVGPVSSLLFGAWIARWFNRSIAQISITLSDVAVKNPQQLGQVNLRRVQDLPQLQEKVDLVVARVHEVNLELQAARERVIAAARLAAVGEMSAGLAHELRNPLTSVKLLVQNAAQRQQRTLTEKQTDVVMEEIVRMEAIIDQLLDFARPPRMSRLRHDLRGDITRAIGLIETQARDAGVRVVCNLPDDPIEINADVEQIHQVIRNLLLNAIDAMPAGGALTITAAVDPHRPTSCTVSVSDTGSGIATAIMPRLFEPFVTDKARGTGLGLAICRRIVTGHDGDISAANSADGGAVFTIVLPCFEPALALPEGGRTQHAVSHPASDEAIAELQHVQIAGH